VEVTKHKNIPLPIQRDICK